MADQVFPVGFFDDAPVLRTSFLHVPFLVNLPLDPGVLRTSLEAVISRERWRKLGARLRRNEKQKLEWHVPVKFSSARRAIRFGHVRHHIPRAKHVCASQIPDQGVGLAVCTSPEHLRELWYPKSTPPDIAYFLARDEPLIGLYVTSFDDSTVLSIDFPHIMLDALAFGALMKAWTLQLQGRQDEILTPRSLEPYPLAELGRYPSEPYLFKDRLLSLRGIIHHGLCCLGRKFLYGQELRSICVPASFLQSLRDQDPREDEFLSDGDILAAWWHRLNNLHLVGKPQKLTILSFTYSIRRPLTIDLLQGNAPYLGNAVVLLPLLLPAGEVLNSSIIALASRVRATIKTLGTRAQVDAFASEWRQLAPWLIPFVGSASAHYVRCSNWSQADLFDADFACASSNNAYDSQTTSNHPGRPAWVQPIIRGPHLLDWMFIGGKDQDENYWLTAGIDRQRWKQIQAAIELSRDSVKQRVL